MFYSQRIHDKCYRRPHFDAGQFVEKWDDEARASRLLPLQGGLQGPDHLQRLQHHALERRRELPHRLRPRLHRLQRRRLLGQGLVLRPPDQHHDFGVEANADKVGGTPPAWWARRWWRMPPSAPSSARRHRSKTRPITATRWRADHVRHTKPKASSSTTAASASSSTRSPASRATCVSRSTSTTRTSSATPSAPARCGAGWRSSSRAATRATPGPSSSASAACAPARMR
jgi:hypothetical protein